MSKQKKESSFETKMKPMDAVQADLKIEWFALGLGGDVYFIESGILYKGEMRFDSILKKDVIGKVRKIEVEFND